MNNQTPKEVAEVMSAIQKGIDSMIEAVPHKLTDLEKQYMEVAFLKTFNEELSK